MNKSINYIIIITNERLSHKKVSITKAVLLQTFIIIHPAIPVYIVLIRKKNILKHVWKSYTKRNEYNVTITIRI